MAPRTKPSRATDRPRLRDVIAVPVLIVLLPLAGAAAAGRPLAPLFEFPPRLEIAADSPRFSWWAASLVIGVLAALLAFAAGIARDAERRAPVPSPTAAGARRSLPWWGWLAFGWIGLWWALAWTRAAWFEALQRYTFFPLWLGFLIAVNALTWRRGGRGLMWCAPGRWAQLFLVSVAFWWGFEWLNRFVRNWHYLEVEYFSALPYVLNASLCFSTVLPAVLAVREWIGDDRRWLQRFAAGPSGAPWLHRGTGRGLVAAGALALFLTGAYPQICYPALWLAPLLLGLGVLVTTAPARLQWLHRGDWRVPVTWAAAALTCGFWWELWNVHSLAKWVYTVPHVDRWHLFEMPLLGYTGYLPFGWECGLVVAWVLGRGARDSS